MPSSHNVDVPYIKRTEYSIMSIDEQGYCSLMHTTTNELRSDIKLPDDTDEDVMKNIENRTNKVKTFPPFEPQNISLKSAEEAINSFKINRAKLIGYITGTKDDLRNHV